MDIVAYMRQSKGFVSIEGAREESVKAAEKELGLRFSGEYRAYVSALGIASFYGHELTGIGPISRLNVVTSTKANREFVPSIPGDFYVVEEAHIDGIVYWQNSKGEIYRSKPNHDPEPVYPSLLAYLEAD